jgi:hypothetical protein
VGRKEDWRARLWHSDPNEQFLADRLTVLEVGCALPGPGALVVRWSRAPHSIQSGVQRSPMLKSPLKSRKGKQREAIDRDDNAGTLILSGGIKGSCRADYTGPSLVVKGRSKIWSRPDVVEDSEEERELGRRSPERLSTSPESVTSRRSLSPSKRRIKSTAPSPEETPEPDRASPKRRRFAQFWLSRATCLTRSAL